MKLTREEALEYHIQMWTDMLAKLGEDGVGEYDCDCAYGNNKLIYARNMFKMEWCQKHFPNEDILEDCFLCEYAWQMQQATGTNNRCCHCPIKWHPTEVFFACEADDKKAVVWSKSPISEILALPERK